MKTFLELREFIRNKGEGLHKLDKGMAVDMTYSHMCIHIYAGCHEANFGRSWNRVPVSSEYNVCGLYDAIGHKVYFNTDDDDFVEIYPINEKRGAAIYEDGFRVPITEELRKSRLDHRICDVLEKI